jgi:hypothetical protein
MVLRLGCVVIWIFRVDALEVVDERLVKLWEEYQPVWQLRLVSPHTHIDSTCEVKRRKMTATRAVDLQDVQILLRNLISAATE